MAEATTELETAPTAGVPAPAGGVPAEVMGDEPGQGAALDTIFQGAPPTAAEAWRAICHLPVAALPLAETR